MTVKILFFRLVDYSQLIRSISMKSDHMMKEWTFGVSLYDKTVNNKFNINMLSGGENLEMSFRVSINN
jgi:hypothetical protein